MRSSKSRSRNKSRNQRSLGNIVNRVFDSSGPEGKVRGTPQQIIEKYLALARDAQLSNDRVAEQSFLQHAEHYTRMLGEAQREQAERQAQFGGPNAGQGGDDRDERQNGGQGGQSNGHGYAMGGGERRDDRGEDRRQDRDQSGRDDRDGSRDANRDGRRDDRSDRGERRDNRRDDRRDTRRDDRRQDRAAEDATPAAATDETVGPAVSEPVAAEDRFIPAQPVETGGDEAAADRHSAVTGTDDAPGELPLGMPEPVAVETEAGPVETPESQEQQAKPARARRPATPRTRTRKRADADPAEGAGQSEEAGAAAAAED